VTEHVRAATGSFPDASTQLLGVVGHPVAHSLSPAVWNPALQASGHNAMYLAFDVSPEGLGAFVDGMRVAGARGLNVTVPHKAPVLESCERMSEPVQQMGVANVVVFDEGRACAHNTDVDGLRAALGELGFAANGTRVLVVGAGGAGRAAAWMLVADGAEVVVANRTAARAERIRQALGSSVSVAPYADVAEAAGTVDAIVHAAAVGMDGETLALGEDVLQRAAQGPCRALLDVAYGPEETLLAREARELGIPAADGLGMLVWQAAAAWRLFWDEEAPVGVMGKSAWAVAGRAD
jgi:shikimate dehydrogenase